MTSELVAWVIVWSFAVVVGLLVAYGLIRLAVAHALRDHELALADGRIDAEIARRQRLARR